MANDPYGSIPYGFETVVPVDHVETRRQTKRWKTENEGRLQCKACNGVFARSTFRQTHKFICQGLDERGNPRPGREQDFSTEAYKRRYESASPQVRQCIYAKPNQSRYILRPVLCRLGIVLGRWEATVFHCSCPDKPQAMSTAPFETPAAMCSPPPPFPVPMMYASLPLRGLRQRSLMLLFSCRRHWR